MDPRTESRQAALQRTREHNVAREVQRLRLRARAVEEVAAEGIEGRPAAEQQRQIDEARAAVRTAERELEVIKTVTTLDPVARRHQENELRQRLEVRDGVRDDSGLVYVLEPSEVATRPTRPIDALQDATERLRASMTAINNERGGDSVRAHGGPERGDQSRTYNL